ncbi:(Fe-S)-binding protein [Campylobacter sp. RM9939]|uniref:(Fe-S)-binding protein n=1 Tax=Campylobacter molothri TaxID=1032242 RepID=UPI001D2B0383|nr:(Fe-S)-binding protein [Campylobacter sp. RM10536]MBZ7951761.1 (Fe-S)-binding protein [Campylobacter sp. RM9939]MBZ7956173.1 (Fe-S)-binding protein [Campylobacter sp. RM10541]
MNNISDICVKCGKCIPSCTIYDINRDEVTNPRGFLDLIAAYKEGKLQLNKELENVFESCFLCNHCVEICPSELSIDNAIEKMRFDIVKEFGMPWYKKIILSCLKNRKWLDILAKLGYIFQSCAFHIQNKEFEKNLGMRAKFSMPFIKKGRFLSSFHKKSFLNLNPDFIDNGGNKTIGLYVGCLTNYCYTQTGFSTLKILKELNINVDLMKKQACCGVAHFFSGDFKSVEILAKKNIEYFEKKLEKLNAIIIPEATCSAMLKIDYERFFIMQNERDWANRAKKISSKIYIASQYLYQFTSLKKLLKNKKQKKYSITYHDPCHARKIQGIFKEPRELLKTNYTYIEMQDSNTCCGFGGVSMQMKHYDKALSVGEKKVKMIDQTMAHFVSAECSACRMQISNNLEQKSSKVVFAHPLELIAEVL